VVTPVSSSYWFLLVAALFIGVGLGANPPITVNLVAEHSDAGERGVAVGLRLVANRSGQVVQPMVFGGIASVVGLALAFRPPVSSWPASPCGCRCGSVASGRSPRPW